MKKETADLLNNWIEKSKTATMFFHGIKIDELELLLKFLKNFKSTNDTDLNKKVNLLATSLLNTTHFKIDSFSENKQELIKNNIVKITNNFLRIDLKNKKIISAIANNTHFYNETTIDLLSNFDLLKTEHRSDFNSMVCLIGRDNYFLSKLFEKVSIKNKSFLYDLLDNIDSKTKDYTRYTKDFIKEKRNFIVEKIREFELKELNNISKGQVYKKPKNTFLVLIFYKILILFLLFLLVGESKFFSFKDF